MPVNETSMLMAGIRSKDLSCKNKLGYPRLFASLSQQWAKATLLDTCDGTVLLHDAKQAAMWEQTVWPKLPPNKWERDQPSKHDDALITLLWDQLAKVDYFSPLLWKVDVYGNVLYRFADAGTPLSWSVDLLFPLARGGLSKAGNMRIVQSQAHLNKADQLEFLLTPDMVCTGLSMLDFKLQVKHSMEALLTRYGKQATALPVQAAPERGATLDRQHQSMSKRRAQQQGQRHSREEVPLGLKATRVAHAAAVSSRVFSPSMRSPYSGQGEPNALPSQHELDDTLGFVQRQGSFHSEHAIQHLMTDQPYSEPSSRHLAKHASLPSQRSLHRRDSANSHQRQSSMPRQSFQTDASDHQSQHSYVSAPRAYSSSRHSQQDGGSHSQRPPLGNSQMIAHSALFQSIPVSPSNGHIPTDHCEHTSHGPHGLSATAGAPHDSYQPSEHCPWQPQYHGQPPSSATAVDRHDRHQADKHRQQDYQPGLSYQSPTALAAPAAAVEVPLTAFLSADSFASDMLSSDNNQTAQWDNSVLQHIQEGSEVAAPQQGVSAHGSLADAALQSADSFASDPLSTDMTNTAHWGKRMLSELHQVAEEEMHQEVQIHQEAQPAVHAALGNLEAEGMHPPTDQAGAGPHDWLWLPDELSSIRDSELSSIDGVRPDIDTWLTQQQASRIASTTQHGTAQRAQHGSSNFKPGDRLQPAVSPTSPLNTADTLDSTYFEDHQADNAMPKAHSSLPWAQNSTSATSYSPQLRPPAHTEELDSGQVPAPEPDTFLPQSSTYTSPFAHWSCAPILGANIQPDQPTVARFDHPQQQERQPDVDAQASTLQGSTYYSNEACAKQRELDSRLAALDLLEFPSGDGDIFEGFGSPLQTRHTSSGQAQPESLGCQLYNTEAPLPVDAPGATLSAPEEALLASMKEMLHGASLHQQASWQHHSVSEGEAAPTSNGHSLEYSAPGATADGLTFHTPPIGGRSPSAAKAASTSPDPFAPATPDHAPALPPCKVNPLTDFHSMLASQEDASCGNAALSSFQKLLGSRDVNQQARLSRFQELLASQEVEQDGQALSSLAGRVRGMAAQLNVLQKRTQELQLASSPARRVSSPFKSRSSRASSRSLAALSSTSNRSRAEPGSPTSSYGRAATSSPVSSRAGGLQNRRFQRS